MARERGKAKIESLEFRPAEGGLISEMRKRVSRGGSGGGPAYEMDHETTVHPTMEHAEAHLRESLGHVFEGAKEESVREPEGKGSPEE